MTHRTLVGIGTLLTLAVTTPSTQAPAGRSAPPQNAAQPAVAPGQTITRLADGRFLVVGGEGATAPASIWDPRANTIAATAGSLSVPRSWHTATLLPDGTVLLAGGKNDAGLVEMPELFEPATAHLRRCR